MLTPGQLLYMPAGFPHTTDTLNLGEPAPPAAADDSVHLTIGIDTHIWGLDYLGARAGALKRAALPDQCTATKLPEEAHWKLMGIPPHLGFLRRHAAAAWSTSVWLQYAVTISRLPFCVAMFAWSTRL